jgi:hypothetical protein
MVSGDPLQIIHAGGDGNTISYTSAVDFVVTHWGSSAIPPVQLNSWVSGVSGIYQFLGNPDVALINGMSRPVVLTGNSITLTDTDLNSYGLIISGFEL